MCVCVCWYILKLDNIVVLGYLLTRMLADLFRATGLISSITWRSVRPLQVYIGNEWVKEEDWEYLRHLKRLLLCTLGHNVYTYMEYICIAYTSWSTKEGERDNPDKQDTYDTDQTNKTHETKLLDMYVLYIHVHMYIQYIAIIKGHLDAQPWELGWYIQYCICMQDFKNNIYM